MHFIKCHNECFEILRSVYYRISWKAVVVLIVVLLQYNVWPRTRWPCSNFCLVLLHCKVSSNHQLPESQYHQPKYKSYRLIIRFILLRWTDEMNTICTQLLSLSCRRTGANTETIIITISLGVYLCICE